MRHPVRLSWWKRWLFRLIAVGLSIALLEPLCATLWWCLDPNTTWSTVHATQQSLKERAEMPSETTEAIHPYLGWVIDPQSMSKVQRAGGEIPVNSFGLVDDAPSVMRRQPGVALIGITGGSVALDMSWQSEQALRDRLAELPEFRGKEIHIVRLAMSGYKQPQQLMTLSYILALGGELDYLINIDGYNELALAVEENYRADVFLAYPRMWQHRLQDIVDPRTASTSFQLLRTRARRQSAAILVSDSWLRHSWAANYLWLHYDRMLVNQQIKLGDHLRKHQETHGRSFAEDGPENDLPDRDAAIERAIELWTQSSRQLDRLCRANGIRYLHAIQPNQYHENSKPLSEQERSHFYAPEMDLALLIHDAYPRAIVAGARLQLEGIEFHDLTQLFAHETDTLYSDYFCHYNQRGYDLLANAIADAIPSRASEE